MRLIDADALKAKICEMQNDDKFRYNVLCEMFREVNLAPTVDAVEIVRCRDCKWWWKEWETCTHNNLVDGYTCATTFKADEYCSYGEKK